MNDLTNTTTTAEALPLPVAHQMIDIADLSYSVADLMGALDMALGEISDRRQRDFLLALSDVILHQIGDLKGKIEVALSVVA